MRIVQWDKLKPTITTQEHERKSMSKNQYIRTVLNNMRLGVQKLRENGVSMPRATWQMAKNLIKKQDKIEHWGNQYILAQVDRQHYTPIAEGGKKDMTNYIYIAFHSHDKLTDAESGCGWQIKQWIKNDLCGEEWEGVELFPMESRMMNTANEYHLFCYPFELPVGQNVWHTGDGGANVTDCKDGGIGLGSKQTLQVRSDNYEQTQTLKELKL